LIRGSVKENILFGRPFLVAGAKSRVVGIFSHTRMVLNIGILKLMSSNVKMHVWTKNLQVASALMAFQGLINHSSIGY